MGDIELLVPRSRKGKFPTKLLERYARRCHSVDQVLLACFCLGLSTRKAASVLAPVLKEKVSASTISRIAQGLNQEVDRYHSRRLQDRYKYLFFDGVVLKSKSEIRVVCFGVRPCNHTLTYLPLLSAKQSPRNPGAGA
jgi:putative transposase